MDHSRTHSEHLLVAVEESDSSVSFFDPQHGAEIGRVKVGLWPHEIALSEDGRMAYVTNFGLKDYDETIGRPGNSISVIDVAARCEAYRLYTWGDGDDLALAPHGVKLRPGTNKLYVNCEAGTTPSSSPQMLVFDLDDLAQMDGNLACRPRQALPLALGSPVGSTIPPPTAEEDANRLVTDGDPDGRFVLPRGTHNLLFSSDGFELFVYPVNFAPAGGKPEWGLLGIDPDTGKTLRSLKLPNGGTAIRGLALHPRGNRLIGAGRGRIYDIDVKAFAVREIPASKPELNQFLYPAVTPDGTSVICPAVWDSLLAVFDLEKGEETHRIPTGLDPIQVVVAPDGKEAFVSHGRSPFVAKLDVTNWEISANIPTKGGPNGLAVAPRAESPKRGTLRFGAVLPLSGPNYVEGRELRLGYEFWREGVNASGGILVGGVPHMVEIEYRDSRSTDAPGEHERLTWELLKDGVDFLLGGYPTKPHVEIATVANDHRVPMVTASGAGEALYEDRPFLFGIMSPARVYLEGTLRALSELKDKPKTVCFVSCSDPAALEDARKTAIVAKELGMTLVPDRKPENLPRGFEWDTEGGFVRCEHQTVDWREFIDLMKEEGPDLMLNTGHLPESRHLALQMKEAEYAPKAIGFSVGPALTAFRSFLASNGVSVQHLFGPTQWLATLPLRGNDRWGTPAEFARAFFERFSMPASYFSAGAAACGLVYEDALRRSGSTDAEEVRKALSLTDLRTFYASIELDHRGLNDSKPMISTQLRLDERGSSYEVIVWPPIYKNGEVVYPFGTWQG